jgi:hypothetical protein
MLVAQPVVAAQLAKAPTPVVHDIQNSATQAPGRGHCYTQTAGETGITIVSQKFARPYAEYDAAAADDFTLADRCTLRTITVVGTYFNGPGQADSFNVAIYDDTRGKPGNPWMLEHHLRCVSKDTAYKDNQDGTWTIRLPKTWTLVPGTCWVSVQANMNFDDEGEWAWETDGSVPRRSLRGAASVWRNPPDGFGTGCTEWRTTTSCLPYGEGGDFAFTLN